MIASGQQMALPTVGADEPSELGWVPLYRRLINSPAWVSAELWKVYCWCLLRASFKHRWVSVSTGRGATQIELQPGQFVFGRQAAAPELQMPAESVRTRIAKLKELRLISTAPTTHYTIITVCNYTTCENSSGEPHQPNTNHPPTKHQPNTTNKNVEKGEKGEKQELPDGGALPFVELAKKWNAIPGVIHCRDATTKRKNDLRKRLLNRGWRDSLDDALAAVASSAFLLGENDRGWQADIDWFLRPDSLTKVLEGKYGNGAPIGVPTRITRPAPIPEEPPARVSRPPEIPNPVKPNDCAALT